MNVVLAKMIIRGIIAHVDCECKRPCKTDEYLDTENCSCEKRLFGKLVLECEDEILNST